MLKELMLPLLLVGQVPPPAPTQVQVQVRLAGKVSATVTPVTGSGPALLAVIVYVVLPPGMLVVVPLVLLIDKSADKSRLVSAKLSALPELPLAFALML